MQKFRKLLLILLVIPCCFFMVACSSAAHIIDAYRDGDYTVYVYSDGTKSYVLADGKNGQNGKNLTLDSIFEELIELGYYTQDDFLQFVSDYVSGNIGDSALEEAAAKYTENQIISKTILSTVSVWSEFPTYTIEYGRYVLDTQVSAGAGIIYEMNDNYAYIITNYHVVYYSASHTATKIAKNIYVYLYGSSIDISINPEQTDTSGYPTATFGGNGIKCEYIGGSLQNDIAVLKVAKSALTGVNPNVRIADIADSWTVGETTFAVGNPEAEGYSITKGIVSVESEYLKMKGADDTTDVTYRVIRTDSAVNGGNSGGGLYNSKGELIGIVNAKLVDVSIDNMAYALVINKVTKIADSIIANYISSGQISSAKYLYLGISVHSANSNVVFNPTDAILTIHEEVVISSVTGGSLAAIIGLKANDIVTKLTINGIEYDITRIHHLTDMMFTIKAGDEVIFTVMRDSVSRDINIASVSSGNLIAIG